MFWYLLPYNSCLSLLKGPRAWGSPVPKNVLYVLPKVALCHHHVLGKLSHISFTLKKSICHSLPQMNVLYNQLVEALDQNKDPHVHEG